MQIVINIPEEYDTDVLNAFTSIRGTTPEKFFMDYIYDLVVRYKLQEREKGIEQTIRDSVADLKRAQK